VSSLGVIHAPETCPRTRDGCERESFAECVAVYADWELDGGIQDDPADEVEEADEA